MPGEFPSAPPSFWEGREQLEEIAQRPVKLLLLYNDPRIATYNYTKHSLAFVSDRVQWVDSYLCLETKLGFVPWIISKLGDEPQDIILNDSQNTTLAQGMSEIINYLSSLGLSVGKRQMAEPRRRKVENTVLILPLESFTDSKGVTFWKGIYWNQIEKSVKADETKSDEYKSSFLDELKTFGTLADTDQKKFILLYNWLRNNFDTVVFTTAEDIVVKQGILVEIPENKII